MSQDLYLKCKSHEPPIWSSSEVGVRLSDLPKIREYIAHRKQLCEFGDYLSELGLSIDGDQWGQNAMHFLMQHPNCEIGIGNSLGEEYPCSAQ